LAIWQKQGIQKKPEREKVKRERHISRKNSLRRVLGVPFLLLYGLVTIIGAGIYVLVGPAVPKAGMTAPLVFPVAGLLFSAVAGPSSGMAG
jgi:amino acid permease